MIDLKMTPGNLVLAQFKANNGLSHSDIVNIFRCTLEQSKQWSESGAPDSVNITIQACEGAIVRWRQASGAFSDIDRQLYESQIEQLQRSIQDEKSNHSAYFLACESESITKIALKRAKRKLVWFKATKPFAWLLTRGQ